MVQYVLWLSRQGQDDSTRLTLPLSFLSILLFLNSSSSQLLFSIHHFSLFSFPSLPLPLNSPLSISSLLSLFPLPIGCPGPSRISRSQRVRPSEDHQETRQAVRPSNGDHVLRVQDGAELPVSSTLPPGGALSHVNILLRSKQNAKLFDFLHKNRLIFVVLSGRFQNLF